MVDFSMDIQQATHAPRVFYLDDTTEVERGVSNETIAGLASRGHTVVRRSMPFGGGQGIVSDWENGNLVSGSDHRKDGCAIGC